ncbi:MAG: bifunctional phosphoglucose/phosphomannose isomerase [Thermoplasmata archaeon]|nr:bifunctional phosphoglucose/phosphomannose isomerase [Thermoplasmata archaeon]
MLDDIKKIHAIDKSNMLAVISSLPSQIERTKSLIEGLDVPKLNPSSIVISGMGGSSVGGELLRDWLNDKMQIPIIVNRTSALPRFAGRDTFSILVSYSGNTHETLACAEQALRRGSNVVGITSGGKLEKLCRSRDFPCILLPPGMPPRGAIGYLFSSIAFLLQEMALVRVEEEIHEARGFLEEIQHGWATNVETKNNEAKKIAKLIEKRTPTIYGHTFYNAVARRWKTQINENAKTLAWWSEIPEMGHNEIEGWVRDSKGKKFAAIFLRDRHENTEIRNQVKVTVEMLGRKSKTHEVWAQGATVLSRMLYNMYLGDYVSFYLAVLKGVDPMPVSAIQEVKKRVYSS